jgi:hypothetical protein
VHALQRVDEIFSIELTKEQLQNISGVLLRNAPVGVAGAAAPAFTSTNYFEIPARVKKIMAQYNFIYI